MENQDRSLIIWGGISGVVMTVVYGLGQSLPAAGIDVTPATLMQIFFWTAAAFGPLGVINSFAIYKALAWERQGAANRLALLMSLLAYAIVTMMLLVQGSVSYYAMELTADSSLLQLLRAVDLGMDLAWDIFMGASLVADRRRHAGPQPLRPVVELSGGDLRGAADRVQWVDRAGTAQLGRPGRRRSRHRTLRRHLERLHHPTWITDSPPITYGRPIRTTASYGAAPVLIRFGLGMKLALREVFKDCEDSGLEVRGLS